MPYFSPLLSNSTRYFASLLRTPPRRASNEVHLYLLCTPLLSVVLHSFVFGLHIVLHIVLHSFVLHIFPPHANLFPFILSQIHIVGFHHHQIYIVGFHHRQIHVVGFLCCFVATCGVFFFFFLFSNFL
ncbi:hypothetical protein IC575_021683 [Cucumis melo]